MTIQQEQWDEALRLAQGVVARHDAPPIDLSTRETMILAECYLALRDSVTKVPTPEKTRIYTAPNEHLNFLREVAEKDIETTIRKDLEYRASWKRRGGIGAFMMLARKWDRLEPYLAEEYHYDIFAALDGDLRPEGVRDDIGDLRRYLALVEAHFLWSVRG